MPQTQIATTAGNTPLDSVPTDYLPAGASARWLVLAEGPDAGKKLFFYDTVLGEGVPAAGVPAAGAPGAGPPAATLLFVHGNPECSYTYRQIVEAIASQSGTAVRVIAMDHIGFGLSDQASFEMVDMHHAANLRQLVEHLALEDLTLVIHDWGGAIGIGALIDRPERVSKLAIINSTVFPMPAAGFTYSNFPFPGPLAWNRLGHYLPWRLWRHVAPLVMFSPAGKPAFAGHSLKFIGRSLLGRLTAGERLYRDMFHTRANALSSMRNVKQTRVWGHGYRYFDQELGWQDNRDFYTHIQQQLGEHWGPQGQNIAVRGFWGLWDPVGKESVRQQWLAALPQLAGNIQLFPERGHFLEEQEPAAIAAGIVAMNGL